MLVAPTADGSRPGYAWYNPMDWIPNEIKDHISNVADKLIPNEVKDPRVGIPLGLIGANYLPKMLPGGSDQTLIQQAIQKGINPMNFIGDNEPLDIEDWNENIPQIDITKNIPRPSGEVGTGTGTGDPFGWLYGMGEGIGNVVTGAGNVAKKIGQTIIPGGETGYGDIYG